MAIILIEAIKTTTVGGYAAEITGISPLDATGLLVGMIKANQGKFNVSWNEYGICGSNDTGTNISIHNDEIEDVILLAKSLSQLQEQQ